MKELKTIQMVPAGYEYKDLDAFLRERNRLLLRGEARTKRFNDEGRNFYWYRLKTLNKLNPEFAGLGKVTLKKEDK